MGIDVCIQDIMRHAGVDENDAFDIIHQMLDEKNRIVAEMSMDMADEHLRQIAGGVRDRAQKEAIEAKRRSLADIVRRDEWDREVGGLMRTGVVKDWAEGIVARLIGTHKGVAGARTSMSQRKDMLEHRWIGKIFSMIQEERPHVLKLMRDKGFLDSTTLEMFHVDRGVSVTGNQDAVWLAQVLSDVSDLSRRRLVAAGADVKRLRNWLPQRHDPLRIMHAGREQWKEFIIKNDLLDRERTFGRIADEQMDEVLDEVFDHIVRGRDVDAVTDWQNVVLKRPADLARKLSEQHRALFFKDAESWMAYSEKFGGGDVVDSVLGHLRINAQNTAKLEILGHNPQAFLETYIRKVEKDVWKNPLLSDEEKKALTNRLPQDLNQPVNRVAMAWKVSSGEADRAVPNFAGPAKWGMAWATMGSSIRSWVSMGKLGMAVISSVTDVATAASRLRWHGINPVKGYSEMLRGLLHGKTPEDQQAIAHLLGVGFDSMLGDIHARFMAEDQVHGRMSKYAQKFFKLSGLTWWTERMRESFALMSSAHMAMQTKKGWAELDDGYRHLLGLHGIGEREWKVVQKLEKRAADGREFVVPEAVRFLDEADIAEYVAPELAKYEAHVQDEWLKKRPQGAQIPSGEPGYEAHKAMHLDPVRPRLMKKAWSDLEDKLSSFFLDETAYGVIQPDDRTRMWQTAGMQPGTVWGEVARFMMQFKSFPIAFTQKAIMPHLKGRPGGKGDFGGLAQLIAGTTVLGALAMTTKDALKGREPRDFSMPNTWLAAMIQGGGAGIYGDFLLGKFSRFGDSPLKTVEGPFLNTADDLARMLLNTLHGDPPSAGQSMYMTINNTPFVNLWYTRLPLDYMILYNLQEMASPGHLRRTQRRLKKEYGQEFILPPGDIYKHGGGIR
ncbi:hypothetical protein [Salidesulfovibrio brasiliensis]|uniref:hypothetical protein n=1 Tax=Salidesulfovibrio brasiliensis TaxID=221711 RepID=UPI0006D0AB5F|nr:hypothetical protein [Salidesulfovibrio brasiliensis]